MARTTDGQLGSPPGALFRKLDPLVRGVRDAPERVSPHTSRVDRRDLRIDGRPVVGRLRARPALDVDGALNYGLGPTLADAIQAGNLAEVHFASRRGDATGRRRSRRPRGRGACRADALGARSRDGA